MWSDLPEELLAKIVEYWDDDSPLDVDHFRLVCRSWRSAIPRPPRLITVTTLPILGDGWIKKYFTVWVCRIYRFEPNPTTFTFPRSLSFVLKFEVGVRASLIAPKSCKKPRSLNLLDFRVSEISKFYRVIDYGFEKIVMNNSSDVIMLGCNGKLYVLKSGDQQWSVDCYFYDDVTTYNNKFYALRRMDGTAVVIDPCSNKSSLVTTQDIVIDPCSYSNNCAPLTTLDTSRILVESLGHLLLVDRETHMHTRQQPHRNQLGKVRIREISEQVEYFRVYKLDEVRGKWVRMTSLCGQALFASKTSPFSIAARDFVGYKENCIYYYSNAYLNRFNMEDGSTHRFSRSITFFSI